jgi:hypothetical protein
MTNFNNEKTHIISTGLTILHRMCQEIVCFAPDDERPVLEYFDDYFKTEKKLVANEKYFVIFWKELYHLIMSGKVEKGAKIAVWFTHFNYEKDDPNYKNNLTIEDMLFVLEYCEIIFTKCDYWTNWLIRRGVDRNKIINLIVGGGVDFDLFQKTDLPGEYIGVVGHYNPRKNGQFVLDLMRRMSDFPWMIVGDNWENISNFKLVTKELKNFRYVI